MNPIIIAIDGFSSCGKSTLAKALANELHFSYMDTGAMYRAVTLFFLRKNLKADQLTEEDLNNYLDQIHIEFVFNSEKNNSDTFLNGENVEEIIRGKEVSEKVSAWSQIKTIRTRMIDLQRKAGKNKGLVIDGRDIGTVVFPNAEFKIFMTADPLIRAKRRFDELVSKKQSISMEEVIENLKMRDYNDENRKENPLLKADDAFVLDNTSLNQKEQLRLILDKIKGLSLNN